MKDQNYLPVVRDQYESLPFPPRDPQDEHKRLFVVKSDILDRVNHYAFKGRAPFTDHFRVLVAGGGTGDSTIFLAWQLRNTNAQVVHLDMSANSIEVAKARAQIRGLHNIVWHHESLLNLPRLNLEPFDYISCTGVLHHLQNPSEGLEVLTQVLKPQGAMGLMVYGKYGRTAVYQMQQLMRLINQDTSDKAACLANTREILTHLPKTNWFIRGSIGDPVGELIRSDSNLYDTLLHSQDVAYSVLELYDWVQAAGLYILEFTDFLSDELASKRLYRPEFFLPPGSLLDSILKQPLKNQQAIAEIIGGIRSRHTVYVAKSFDRVADVSDPSMVPFYFLCPPTFKDQFDPQKNSQKWIKVCHPLDPQLFVKIQVSQPLLKLLNLIDGQKTVSQIFDLARAEGVAYSHDEMMALLTPAYKALNSLDLLILKKQS